MSKPLVAAILLVTCMRICAQLTPSTDIIPLSSPVYDLLARLAQRELLPSHQSQEFTIGGALHRGEALSLAALARQTGSEKRLSARDDASLSMLERMLGIGGPVRTLNATYQWQSRHREFAGDDRLATASSGYRAMGAAALPGGWRMEGVISDLRRLEGAAPEQFPILDTAIISRETPGWRFDAGLGYNRWGAGFGDSLILSDDQPPYWHLGIQGKIPLPIMGTWMAEQVAGAFQENGETKYFMARRFSRDLTRKWSVSAGEAFKATKLPDAALVPFVPWYAYQYFQSKSVGNTRWFNYMADAQVSYRADAKRLFYLDLLLDDVNAPSFFTHEGTNDGVTTPRKIGVLFGGQMNDFVIPNSRLWVEAVFTDGSDDGGTYGNFNPEIAYTHNGLPLGHFIGPGRQGIYVRQVTLAGRWLLSGEAFVSRATSDMIVTTGSRFSARVAYQLAPSFSIGLRYTRVHEGTGSSPIRSGWMIETISLR